MRFLTTPALFVLLLVIGQSARAELIFCNETPVTQSIAVAYSNGGAWKSEGWWNVEPAACTTVVGGELEQRYYYYRATATGRTFTGESYYFCTQSNAFNIGGDENCSSRGFDRSEFRKLDTGKTAKKFTLTLTEAAASGGQSSSQSSSSDSGSMGEPYSGVGVFQGCEIIDGSEYCSVIAEGWQFFAYSGSGTPTYIIDQLYNLSPNTTIEFAGDLVSYGDVSAELVMRSFSVTTNPFGRYLDLLQGEWYHTDDPESHLLYTGSFQESFYGGERMAGGPMRLANSCEGSRGEGPVLLIQEDGDPETLCYVIVSLSRLELVLHYIGGTGQYDYYRKLD